MPEEQQPPIFTKAIQHWWRSKKKNRKRAGKTQPGTRGANLRGDTMDGFRDEIRAKLIDVGVSKDDIFTANHLAALPANLPSYFRASKNWDVVVCKNSRFKRLHLPSNQAAPEPQLIAAIELKSQEGSIGNNQNNRIEESIGSATDFWASYENKNFASLQPRPWLGYLFVGCYEDSDIDLGVEIRQPHFLTDPAFDGVDPNNRLSKGKYLGPSYAHRYRVFLERMIAKKFYDGACFIVTNQTVMNNDVNHRCLFPELSVNRFIDLLVRHVSAYYPD
jgi:hypothetical protein